MTFPFTIQMTTPTVVPVNLEPGEVVRCRECSRRYRILPGTWNSAPVIRLQPLDGHPDATLVMSFCLVCFPTWDANKIRFVRSHDDAACCDDHEFPDSCGAHAGPRYHALADHINPTLIHRQIDNAIKKRVDQRLSTLELSDNQATAVYDLMRECVKAATHDVMKLFSPL